MRRPLNPLVLVLLFLGLGLAVGLVFLLNRQPGVNAEVVVGPTGPVTGDTASVTLCAAPATGLLNQPGSPALAVVQITRATELLDQRQRSPARFQPEDLQPGSYVQIWTDGTIRESAPPQLVAQRIALISDPVPGRPSLCMP